MTPNWKPRASAKMGQSSARFNADRSTDRPQDIDAKRCQEAPPWNAKGFQAVHAGSTTRAMHQHGLNLVPRISGLTGSGRPDLTGTSSSRVWQTSTKIKRPSGGQGGQVVKIIKSLCIKMIQHVNQIESYYNDWWKHQQQKLNLWSLVKSGAQKMLMPKNWAITSFTATLNCWKVFTMACTYSGIPAGTLFIRWFKETITNIKTKKNYWQISIAILL